MINVNETHDPNLKSWIESANAPDTDFPIQNLPFCYFSVKGKFSVGVAIGDQILSLAGCAENNLLDFDALSEEGDNQNGQFEGDVKDLWLRILSNPNSFFDEDSSFWSNLRRNLVRLLRDDVDEKTKEALAKHLYSIKTSEDLRKLRLRTPFNIRDYTDFYCSIFHATNVGAMFRPDNPLLPNYKWLPIGYHGRASSIVVSGTDIKRPKGQNRADAEQPPVFIPCKNLDYEMEVGFFVGQGE